MRRLLQVLARALRRARAVVRAGRERFTREPAEIVSLEEVRARLTRLDSKRRGRR